MLPDIEGPLAAIGLIALFIIMEGFYTLIESFL